MEEYDRARKLLQISLDQQNLQRPELLWKKAIDFEIQLGQHENARNLYEQLLKKAQHVKIWISYASFEEQSNEILNARAIFQRGDDYLKQSDEREARALLLEKWNEFELKQGVSGIDIKNKLPTRIKKKRKLGEGGWEEYVDYIFPDEQVQNKNLSLKNAAHQWKLKFQQTKQEIFQENIVQVNIVENQDANQQSEEAKEQNEEKSQTL